MNNKLENNTGVTEPGSFTELLGQLAKSSATVIHDEIELVIQRFLDKLSAIQHAAIFIATGAALTFAAFLCFCAALIIRLTSYTSPVLAAFFIGVICTVVGIVLAFIGYRQLHK